MLSTFHNGQAPAKKKKTLADQSSQWNEGSANVIQTLLQCSHLIGLIAIHAAYERKPVIYFSQLLTSQLKSIPNYVWILIQQIISARFRKDVTMKYFGLIKDAHSHCLLCASDQHGRWPGRNFQRYLSRDYIFRSISWTSKETKWAAALFSRSARLSFIGSLNHSQISMYIYLLLKKIDGRSSTTHCRAPKFKSDSLFPPFVSQRNGVAQRSQHRDLLLRIFFSFVCCFFLLLFLEVGWFFKILNTSAHSGFGD